MVARVHIVECHPSAPLLEQVTSSIPAKRQLTIKKSNLVLICICTPLFLCTHEELMYIDLTLYYYSIYKLQKSDYM